jgi:hypothetical protein
VAENQYSRSFSISFPCAALKGTLSWRIIISALRTRELGAPEFPIPIALYCFIQGWISAKLLLGLILDSIDPASVTFAFKK